MKQGNKEFFDLTTEKHNQEDTEFHENQPVDDRIFLLEAKVRRLSKLVKDLQQALVIPEKTTIQ